jgi:peptide/nickel transport system permease protein
MARMKGLPESRIVLRHAARNALLPVVTAFTLGLGATVGGNVVVETVFSWPGLGQAIVDAVDRQDYPVLQGAFLLLAVSVICANLLADLLYSYLDPRVRVG